MLKPSKRKVQIAHATTARLHAEQAQEWHDRCASQLVRFLCPACDEGTAGNFSTGTAGLLAGVTGLLPDEKGDPTVPYVDVAGLECLPNKLGRTVAGGLLRILKRCRLTEFYFLLTDAATPMIGHLSGCIAYGSSSCGDGTVSYVLTRMPAWRRLFAVAIASAS